MLHLVEMLDEGGEGTSRLTLVKVAPLAEFKRAVRPLESLRHFVGSEPPSDEAGCDYGSSGSHASEWKPVHARFKQKGHFTKSE